MTFLPKGCILFLKYFGRSPGSCYIITYAICMCIYIIYAHAYSYLNTYASAKLYESSNTKIRIHTNRHQQNRDSNSIPNLCSCVSSSHSLYSLTRRLCEIGECELWMRCNCNAGNIIDSLKHYIDSYSRSRHRLFSAAGFAYRGRPPRPRWLGWI